MAQRRTRGYGTITPAYGKYRAALRYSLDGRQVYRSKLCDTRQEAEATLAEFRAERDRLLAPERGIKTVADLLDAWLASRDVREATLAQYRYAVGAISAIIGHVKLDVLNFRHVEKLLAHDARLSPRTLKLYRGVLGQAARWGMARGLLVSDPTQGVEPIRSAPRAELPPLSPEQVARFLAEAKSERLGNLFVLALVTGLRRAELLGLRWEDVEGDTLQVRTSRHVAGARIIEGPVKTQRSRRSIPLARIAREALEAQREANRRQAEELLALGVRADTEHVFLSATGQPLDPRSVSRQFERFAKRLGLPATNLHALRHWAASALLAQGVPLVELSRYLGHSSTAITDAIYAHLGAEGLRGIAEAWERGVGGE